LLITPRIIVNSYLQCVNVVAINEIDTNDCYITYITAEIHVNEKGAVIFVYFLLKSNDNKRALFICWMLLVLGITIQIRSRPVPTKNTVR
jgi:hypothetical protein